MTKAGVGPRYYPGHMFERPVSGALADEVASVVPGELAEPALVEGMRGAALVIAQQQAAQLGLVAELVARRRPQLVADGATRPQADAAIDDEVACALGVSRGRAAQLVETADGLTRLPLTFDALAAGRLDLDRARDVVTATADLSLANARTVERTLVPTDDHVRPWCLSRSPRAWRAALARAVIAVDPAAAQRRHDTAVTGRQVRTWAAENGMGEFWGRAAVEDVAVIEEAVQALAAADDAPGPDGRPRTTDQRRADAFVAVFRAVLDGRDLPRPSTAAAVSTSIVVTLGTALGTSDDPGELDGLGARTPVTADVARDVVATSLRCGGAQRLLVTDSAGALVRVLTVPPREVPSGGWTLASVRAAVRAGLARAGQLCTDAYTPTAAIRERVHARNPSCDFWDCPRSARRSDLDHGVPHPQGPTDVQNLHPRCRRHHEHKTKQRWAVAYDPVTVTTTWISLTGHRYATRPPPLPGCPDLIPVPAGV